MNDGFVISMIDAFINSNDQQMFSHSASAAFIKHLIFKYVRYLMIFIVNNSKIIL
jgi:hypothetical protein